VSDDRRPRTRRAFVAGFCALLALLCWLRYATFHNETFDLAFYARMAWGMAVFDLWDPILETHTFGLHVSPILIPLGWLGRLLGPVPVLVVAQAVAFGGAALALARAGERHLGEVGAWIGALVLLHPNVLDAGTFEVHPGTLAIWPLAWMLERLDAEDARGLALGALAVLCCREDLALVTAMSGALALTRPALRKVGAAVVVLSLAYLGFFLGVLHPAHAPAEGSFELHFGKWGSSFGEMALTLLTEPGRVVAHLAEPRRLAYLPLLLAPWLLLPLGAPRWFVPALPILGINLVSEFPTAVDVGEHYTTLALPPLAMGAIHALRRRSPRWRQACVAALVGGFVVACVWQDWRCFVFDARSDAGAEIVAAVDPERSVQAPDAILPHLAARPRVFRAPPPDRDAELVVLDVSHRARWRHDQTLLRTDEEPIARNWLSSERYGLVAAAGPWVLLERGADPRGGPNARYFMPAEEAPAMRLTECLGLRRVQRSDLGVAVILEARGECPADLALRIDTSMGTHRTDLLFDGRLSPAHLRRGDVLRSEHELEDVGSHVFVGLVRSSGARAAAEDPPWRRVAVD